MIEQNLQEDGHIIDEDVISHIAGTAFAGGADTIVSTLQSFVLAMAVNQEAQRKARAELDRVVGTHRLPTFEDRSQMPYIDAICKEILRWQPVAPFAGPRATSTDDVYNGYFIPEGCTILPNAWLMLQDPDVYPEPHVFRPERYLVSEKGLDVQRDPAKIAFGFGRRFCPGRHLAQNSIFITVASILSAFDILKATGPNGETMEPRVEYGLNIVRHPLPFECDIRPRSKTAEMLIVQAIEAQK